MSALVDLRFRRAAERLHRRDPRAFAEFLAELSRHHMMAGSIEMMRARYGRLDAAVLAAIGGDRMPPLPIHEVPR